MGQRRVFRGPAPRPKTLPTSGPIGEMNFKSAGSLSWIERARERDRTWRGRLLGGGPGLPVARIGR